MNLRLNPLYKKLLLLTIVLGPMIWLVLTEDGQRRTDLVLLYLFGKGELNLAIEKLHSDMTEAQFRELFPDLELACDDGVNPFGDRLCSAEVGAFSGIPSRAFTLFLSADELRAAKLNYRSAYHETLRRQLEGRIGAADSPAGADTAVIRGPQSWRVADGVLLLPPEIPEKEEDSALMWLSTAAMQRRLESGDKGP
jgi:hypothetical protein